MNLWTRRALALAALLLTAPTMRAQVILLDHQIPLPRPIPEPRLPSTTDCLPLKLHRADVTIVDGVARTTLRQTFHNPASVDLEGQYVLPVPANAAVQDFRLVMNGKELKGEVLDRAKARQIYESIVRRRRDPGLLEYLGYGLMQASVFPIPARSDVEVVVTYSEVLEGGGEALRAYSLPLASCGRSWLETAQVAFTADITTQLPLKMVFCPSHDVEIVKKDDHHARISYEGRGQRDRDLKLLYSLAPSEFGLTLLTYRRPGEDGYFALTVSPELRPVAPAETKDLVFVVDTSGSMNGEKIMQTRDALKFCLRALTPSDRFNIITFSTEARTFAERLVDASQENVARALSFVERLEASGGTNIRDALVQALAMGSQSGTSLFQVLFMTDGQPTVGVQDPGQILRDFRGANSRSVRLFVFGVGSDVNTFLLDKLAEENRGSRDYVAPSENIEIKVSSLFAKVSQPALVDTRITVDGIDAFDHYPAKLPDIFRGTDLVLVGRYRGDGSHAIKLTGKQGGADRSWTSEARFARADETHEFLPRLWAARKVGSLLDQIRLHGSNKELVDEVIRLAKQFGIVTPYTSNLVVEESELKSLAFAPTDQARDAFALRAAGEADRAERTREQLNTLGYIGASEGRAPASVGDGAVDASKAAQKLKDVQSAPPALRFDEKQEKRSEVRLTREVDGQIFCLLGGVWTDSRYRDADKDKVIKVTAFSDSYFKLVAEQPRLGKYFAVGTRVLVCFDGKVYEVVE